MTFDLQREGKGKKKVDKKAKPDSLDNGSDWMNIQASKNLTKPPLEDQYSPVCTN